MKNYQLPTEHYLAIAQKANHPYYCDFLKAFDILYNILSTKQRRILEQKLQLLGANQFSESKFVQIACETVVCAHFAKLYPENFQYEYRCNSTNHKDIDCQFTDGKYTYNIEVKCPGLETYNNKANETPKIELKGRFDEKGRNLVNFIENALHETLEEQQIGWNYTLQKRLDNTLKTFLQEAHNKFPIVEPTNLLNVLIVCCDDEHDMSRWYDYLHQAQGLFTDDSFADPKTYNRVDLVVLTNIFNRHYSFSEKIIDTNSWCLNDAFSLAFINPIKALDYKTMIAQNFLQTFSNYTQGFDYYREELEDISVSPEYAFPILHFLPELKKALLSNSGENVNFFARWSSLL